VVETRIAKRYATSIFELAQSRNETDQVFADMQAIRDTLANSRDLELFLNNPILHGRRKLSALKKIFVGASAHTLALIENLCNRSREAVIGYIAQAYMDLHDQANNLKRLTVSSATPLTVAQREALVQELKTKLNANIELTEEHDPELIGGFVVKVDDQLFDGSVRKQLRDIKFELTHA